VDKVISFLCRVIQFSAATVLICSLGTIVFGDVDQPHGWVYNLSCLGTFISMACLISLGVLTVWKERNGIKS